MLSVQKYGCHQPTTIQAGKDGWHQAKPSISTNSGDSKSKSITESPDYCGTEVCAQVSVQYKSSHFDEHLGAGAFKTDIFVIKKTSRSWFFYQSDFPELT
jgi:hypothetical protein